jgi:peroxiredoxin
MYKFQFSSVQAILIICLVAFNYCGQSQAPGASSFAIRGKVETFDSGQQLHMYRVNPVDQSTQEVANADISNNGEYVLEYNFSGPDLYRLDFPGRQKVLIAVDAGQNDISVEVAGKRGGYVHIDGSPDSELLLGYENFRINSNSKLVSPTYAAMRNAKKLKDTEAEVDAVEAYVKASKQHRKELLDYIEENIGTSIALYGTMLRWTGDDEVARLDRLVQSFATVHPDLMMTKVMEDKVERYKRIAIGAKAPTLSAPTPNGETLSLKDINAEYILIDFWASWCGPCISQVPDLQKVHRDFKDKGFEILSVSLDARADKWKAAISKHELDWLHISDLKVWKSELAQNYNVTFVPFNLLIDKNGVIVAKNIHSKTLYSKLTELIESK